MLSINLKLKKSSSPEIQISWQAIGNGTILIIFMNNIYYFLKCLKISFMNLAQITLFCSHLKLKLPDYHSSNEISDYLCNCLLKILLIHDKIYLRFFLIFIFICSFPSTTEKR